MRTLFNEWVRNPEYQASQEGVRTQHLGFKNRTESQRSHQTMLDVEATYVLVNSTRVCLPTDQLTIVAPIVTERN
jgi:hypothetical protein